MGNELSTAAFRFGHSQINNPVPCLNPVWEEMEPQEQSLQDNYFDPALVEKLVLMPLCVETLPRPVWPLIPVLPMMSATICSSRLALMKAVICLPLTFNVAVSMVLVRILQFVDGAAQTVMPRLSAISLVCKNCLRMST